MTNSVEGTGVPYAIVGMARYDERWSRLRFEKNAPVLFDPSAEDAHGGTDIQTNGREAFSARASTGEGHSFIYCWAF